MAIMSQEEEILEASAPATVEMMQVEIELNDAHKEENIIDKSTEKKGETKTSKKRKIENPQKCPTFETETEKSLYFELQEKRQELYNIKKKLKR